MADCLPFVRPPLSAERANRRRPPRDRLLSDRHRHPESRCCPPGAATIHQEAGCCYLSSFFYPLRDRLLLIAAIRQEENSLPLSDFSSCRCMLPSAKREEQRLLIPLRATVCQVNCVPPSVDRTVCCCHRCQSSFYMSLKGPH